MSHQAIGLLLIILVIIEGIIAIALSHGFNGHYFKDTETRGEPMRRLRADKPITANVIGTCYALILAELIIAILIRWAR